MIILNFFHPFTSQQLVEIESLTGQKVSEVKNISVQFDVDQSFEAQVAMLAESCHLTPQEWQTLPLIIVPPALNFIAVTLLAELHGRMGYFPPIVRIGLVYDSLPPEYKVAETINLQAVRDSARKKR